MRILVELEKLGPNSIFISKKEFIRLPPQDILNDAFDGFGYFVEITTPQFLSTIMKREKSTLLGPNYPYIIVSKFADNIIRDAIESFINSDEDVHRLKFNHVMPVLTIEEIDEILFQKLEESNKLDAEFETE